MKGFAGGLLVGLVVSAAALTGLSLLAPAPQHAVGRPYTLRANPVQAPGDEARVVVAEKADPEPTAEGLPPATPTDPGPEAPSDEATSIADVPEPAPEIAAKNTAEIAAEPPDASPVPAPSAESHNADLAAAAPASPDALGSNIPASAQPAPGADDVGAPAPPLPAAEEQVALTEPPAEQPAPPQPAPEPEPLPSRDSPPLVTPDARPEFQDTEPGFPAPPEPTLPGTSTVRVNRLGAAPAEELPIEEPEPEVLPEDAPALLRYAAAFEPPAEDRPLVSLILLDERQALANAGALAAMPVPVSVAIDPSLPDAAERLAAYRAAGIEALLVASLPDGALPQDAAVLLEGGLSELPETVALLDLGQGGLNALNATAPLGLSMVAREGRGVVLVSQGFNAGLAAAQSAGIPAAEVRRDLDGQGQDAMAVRRGLDDVVRRAGQEGEVVLLGRIRPESLDAVTEWTSQGRAQEVTVAPVSALLAPALPAEPEAPAP